MEERLGERPATFERTQIGVRLEKRMIKVVKGLAEVLDTSMGELLEALVLHAIEGRAPFHEDTLRRIAGLKAVYGMDYGTEVCHKFRDEVADG